MEEDMDFEMDDSYLDTETVTVTFTKRELGFLGSLIAYQGSQINQQIKESDVTELYEGENPANVVCDMFSTKFEMKNLLRIVLEAQGMSNEMWRSLHE